MTTATESISNDVLHIANEHKLSAEEIAKAVARHQREHPSARGTSAPAGGRKATPRH